MLILRYYQQVRTRIIFFSFLTYSRDGMIATHPLPRVFAVLCSGFLRAVLANAHFAVLPTGSHSNLRRHSSLTRGCLTAFSTTWLTYSSNYTYPNPHPMKRIQPLCGETPFVSYVVCVNHFFVEKMVTSTTGGLIEPSHGRDAADSDKFLSFLR